MGNPAVLFRFKLGLIHIILILLFFGFSKYTIEDGPHSDPKEETSLKIEGFSDQLNRTKREETPSQTLTHTHTKTFETR